MLSVNNDRLKNEIETIVKKIGTERNNLIPVLCEIQDKYRHISADSMQIVADLFKITPVEVQGVVSFYSFLDTEKKGRYIIRLSKAISDMMKGAKDIGEAFRSELGIDFDETSKDGMFTLEWTADIGLCDQSPAILINDKAYGNMTPNKVKEVIKLCRMGENKGDIVKGSARNELSFAKHTAETGLKKALEMTPEGIIEELSNSGLRGRGGAGFPTGVKLKFTNASSEKERYVVCNADEGEPGTFKDRVVLADYANVMFEGMTISAYTIGAKEGFVYLRAEYLYLREELEKALEARRKNNLLGKNILGKKDFDFDIKIQMGAGAYVCGEETALLQSLEGFRGEPRNRPPFPASYGYKGKPTAINNVETFGWISCILNNGAKWFKNYGTEKSSGLKLFSVSGDVENPGVYEFPLGTTIEDFLKKTGAPHAKAVQVGGASGKCLISSDFKRRMCFEDVSTGGSVIVFGPKRNMLDVAENFLEFFAHESCGQCTPCRLGNGRLLRGIKMMKRGECSPDHTKDLLSLGETMELSAKCGLGQTSPAIFRSIVELFANEIASYQNTAK